MSSSNLSTGIAVASNMIGSVTLVIPALFRDEGILANLLVMSFMGVIYCKTCQLWSKHCKPSENDIAQIIKRVLGRRYEILLGVSSGLFLALICVIYFLLLNQRLYKVIAFLLMHYNVDPSKFNPESTGIVFDRFSIQYLGFIVLIILSPLYFLKSIDGVVRASKFGMIGLIVYFFTLISMFITSVIEEGVVLSSIKLWPNNVDGWADIAGQFSLAFICHNTIVAVTKDNKNPQQTPKAIAIGYTLTGVLYACFGFFGGVAIERRDYFNQAPFIIIIGITIFLYISSFYGIFPYVARKQFFCFLEAQKAENKNLFIGSGIAIMLICAVFQTLNTSPGLVIALTGTGVGLLVCFILPVWVHMKCYYPHFKENPEIEESSVSNTVSSITQSEDTNNIDQLITKDLNVNKKKKKASVLTTDYPSDDAESPLLDSLNKQCVEHDDQSKRKFSFKVRVAVYSFILFVGVFNFLLQIKLIFW